MKAMVLRTIGSPLVLEERPDPVPAPGTLRLKVEACAVCRTDLHIQDGDLLQAKLPLILGHEIIGLVDAIGDYVDAAWLGRRVGVPWLGKTCGVCSFCLSNAENLCDHPQFTGYTRDGGFATHVIADADFVVELDPDTDPVSLAPLLCAGLIGWRCLKKVGSGQKIGFYGFGAAAHIVTQICIWQGRDVYAFTSPGDRVAQDFALSLGAQWAGDSNREAPVQLDLAIIFAPVGSLVPQALKAVRKGGRVICGGIHMSDIPSMPYTTLWGERELATVANLTRQDAHDFFPIAREAKVHTHTKAYPLEMANMALADLRAGNLCGAAVLVP